MSRARYFAIRTVQTVILFFFIVVFLFWLFRQMPGSYIDQLTFSGASPETVATLEEKWALNDPWYVQFYRFLEHMLNGNAGTSLSYRQPVIDVVKMRIFNTFILVAPAMITTYVLGVIIGTLMGTNRGSVFERYGNLAILSVGTIPSFFTAIVAIIIFASTLNWVPTSGMVSAGTTFDGPWWRQYASVDFLHHYVLPFSVIILRYLFLPSLTMRTNVVEVLGQDFIDYHRMTGLPESKITRHVGKHAILPVVTIFPISMTRAIGGLILIETVFNWPGVGALLVETVVARDIPVVQFVFFLVAAFVLVANFAVDIFYGVIDPRVSVGSS
jgi:peptide/nickel transport system permease protein